MNGTRTCSIEGCGRGGRIVRGLCNKHYKRLKRLGSPTLGKSYYPTPEAGFKARRSQGEGGCIGWTGYTDENGYGILKANGKNIKAHRYSWERTNGEIAPDLMVDHKCHNRKCVNVEHLRLVTHKQNMENRRGANSDSKTGIRGVSWHRQTRKWSAYVWHEGKNYYAGEFLEIEDAEKAAVGLRNKLYTHNDLDRAA